MNLIDARLRERETLISKKRVHSRVKVMTIKSNNHLVVFHVLVVVILLLVLFLYYSVKYLTVSCFVIILNKEGERQRLNKNLKVKIYQTKF